MTRERSIHRGLLLVFGVVALASVTLSARSLASYDLSWNTIDGGGATFCTGGTYRLGGTIGQPDAGTLTGGAYALNGGFWQGGRSLAGIGPDGPGGSNGATHGSPLAFRLYAAAPNPFHSASLIAFDLPQTQGARLAIYNLQGERVATLADGELAAGHHIVRWDGSDTRGASAASGIYLIRLESGTMHEDRKLVLLH